jgi:hypothetical protein
MSSKIRATTKPTGSPEPSQLVDQNAAHPAERSEMLANAAAGRERLLGQLERATVGTGVIERLMAIIRPTRP